MHHIVSRFIVYRNLAADGILAGLADVCRRVEAAQGAIDHPMASGEPAAERSAPETSLARLAEDIYTQVHHLLDLATRYGFDGDLWQCYLAWLLAMTENPFSLSCERRGALEGTVNALATRDFEGFRALFHYDFGPLEQALGIDCLTLLRDYRALDKDRRTYNHHVAEQVRALRLALAQAPDGVAFFRIVTGFYREHGVGLIGMNQVFRLSGSNPPMLEPITNTVDVRLEDLVGYESQKRQLVENTEAFLRGSRANNLLLYGDSGTGKSTCIKALRSAYQDRGLRIIELYKHQFGDLSALISQIKNRNYKFILFLDDLSFEEFEIEYKYLKAVIEGGMEVTPDNVLVYATSNRRHLIRETWSDRKDARNEDDVHHSDTMEEKISLVNRFGLTIWFPRPDQQAYQDIVRGIANRYPEIRMDEETLTREAVRWGLWNGTLSGRRAQQFVNHLLAQATKE